MKVGEEWKNVILVAVAVGGLAGGGAAGVYFWVRPLNYSSPHFLVGALSLVLLAGGALLLRLGYGRSVLRASIVAGVAFGVLTAGASGHLGGALAVAWILALGVGIGERLLGRGAAVGELSLTERAVLAAALGLGVLALGVLGVGLVGGLRGVFVWLPLLLLSLGLVPTWRRLVAEAGERWRRRTANWAGGEATGAGALALTCLVCLAGAWLWALAPPVWYDELNYQVAAPATYVRLGAIVDRPEEFRFLWAHNANMLFTLALLLGGGAGAKLVHFAYGGLAVLATFALGRRLGGSTVGGLAATLFLALPIVSWELGVAYVDLAVAFYVAVVALAGLLAARCGDRRLTLFTGVLAGLAVGVKLNAALYVLPVLGALAVALLLRQGWRRALPGLALAGGGGLLVLVPWLARDWAWTGNPVFPYLNQLFASPRWALDAGMQNFHVYGHRVGLLAAVLLPWDLVANAGAFGEGLGPGVAGALLWLGLPWCSLRRRSPAAKSAGVAWCVILPGLLLTLGAAQYLRYLVPIFVLLAVVAALNLAEAFRWGHARRPRLAVAAALALGFLYLGGSRLAHLAMLWPLPERFPVAYALGLEGREGFLARTVREYQALRHLNTLIEEDAKVVGVGCHARLYTHARLFEAAWGQHELRDLLARGMQGAALAEALLEQGFAALMVNRSVVTASGWQDLPVLTPEFLAALGAPVFAGNGLEVYRLRAEAERNRQMPINLLANPGFEERSPTGAILRWHSYGDPLVGRQGQARRGEVAVLARRNDGLTQPVAVQEGEVYTLGHWTRADAEGQAARLQINWLDGAGRIVEVDIEVVSASPGWRWHTMTVTAPPGAVTANVYASVHEESQVWFDDVCLVQGRDSAPCGGEP